MAWESFTLHLNIILGILTSILTVVLSINPRTVGIRTFLLIVIFTGSATGALLESFWKNIPIFSCILLGLGVGLISDNIFIALNTQVPQFIDSLISDVLQALKNVILSRIKSFDKKE